MKFSGFQRIVLFAAMASMFSLTGCEKSEITETPVQGDLNGKPVEGQFIVVFKSAAGNQSNDNYSVTSQNQILRSRNLRQQLFSELNIHASALRETFEGNMSGFSAKLTPEQVATLKRRAEIAFLEPDRYISLTRPDKGSGKIDPGTAVPKPAEDRLPYTTITPLDGEHIPWHIERVGYGDGTGKTVWVIDSGVDTAHPDLNIDEAKSKSFIYGVTSVKDGFGHGTRVAGIIAAKNNGSGMIGVASNATIVALRVFDDAGQGTTARVVTAVNYAVANGQPGDVINISLGGGISSTLDNAVQKAAEKGFLFAIAAGNAGVDCASTSPARLDAANVYTISAVDSYNQLWGNSNFGLAVDFAAPGVNITSTQLNGNLIGGSNGTSYATPHVAGILLLRKDIVTRGTVIGDKDSISEPIASAK